MKTFRWLAFWTFAIIFWLLFVRSCVGGAFSPGHGPPAWLFWVIIPGTALLAVWVRQFDKED
jgi:hypothetical protein